MADTMPPELIAAYRHCQQIASNHYENFPTASRLIAPDLRPAVAAIYAFARTADDFADEGDASAAVRLKQLGAWETLLERCTKSSVDHPVFLALGDAIRRHRLPVESLHDLLIAYRMDISIHAYASIDELHFYCRHSANPVGRLMLALHAVRAPEALAASDAICTALQLTNFWQDLCVDLPRGRCYLANEWLQPCAIDTTELLAGNISEAQLAPALHAAIDHTESLFARGSAILPYLPLRLRLQIAATLHGGRLILRSVARATQPQINRPALRRRDWLRLILPVLRDTLLPPAALPARRAIA